MVCACRRLLPPALRRHSPPPAAATPRQRASSPSRHAVRPGIPAQHGTTRHGYTALLLGSPTDGTAAPPGPYIGRAARGGGGRHRPGAHWPLRRRGPGGGCHRPAERGLGGCCERWAMRRRVRPRKERGCGTAVPFCGTFSRTKWLFGGETNFSFPLEQGLPLIPLRSGASMCCTGEKVRRDRRVRVGKETLSDVLSSPADLWAFHTSREENSVVIFPSK